MVFTCERCLKEFVQKISLQKHLQKKNPCTNLESTRSRKDILEDIQKRELNDKTYDCEYCGMQFNHRSNKYRHKNTCKLKPHDEMILVKKEEYMALKTTTINNTNSHNNITNNHNNHNTINNNITQNITIVNNFGEEDIDHILHRIEYYWRNKAEGLVEMLKDIHFDPDHPENHTLNIANQRNKIVKVHKDGEWIKKPFDEAIDEAMYPCIREVEKLIEDDQFKRKYPFIMKKINEWWEKVGTENFDYKDSKELDKLILQMILINRHIVK